MKFSEAMKALEEGKKVRRASWRVGHYIRMTSDEYVLNETGAYWELVYTGNNWELYEEPGHDFAWALAQIHAGEKVRRKSSYLGPVSAETQLQFMLISDIIAIDWVSA